MKFDRGIIKWQPFESLEPITKIIQSLQKEKSKIKKPILSEEEIATLEAKIIEAYYSQEKIKISFYQNGFIRQIKGQVKKIDQIYKLIYLNNLKLLFNQIIQIEEC